MTFPSGREVTQVDALRSGTVHAAHDILVDLLGHEGDHRRSQLGQGHQSGPEGEVRVDLALCHLRFPETLSGATDVPVGKLICEVLQGPGRFGDLISAEVRVNFLDQGVEAGKQPPVHRVQRRGIKRVLCRIKAVYIGIQHIERIGVPEGAEEFPLSLYNGILIEAVRQPRGTVLVEVPAYAVCAVRIKSLERVHGVALGLAHLLAVLVKNEPEHDDVLIRGHKAAI